jgi:DNA polymerase V
VNAAVRGLRMIYEPGYQLSKAGVMLQDLCPAEVQQGDLL